jgi:hypothetical protein
MLLALTVDEASRSDFLHLLREDVDIVLVERFEETVARLEKNKYQSDDSRVVIESTYGRSPTSNAKVLGDYGIQEFRVAGAELLRHLLAGELRDILGQFMSRCDGDNM